MHYVEPINCICGAALEILTYDLGLRGESVLTSVECPVCRRQVGAIEIDGIILVEIGMPFDVSVGLPVRTDLDRN